MSYSLNTNKWEVLFPHTVATRKNASGFPAPRAGQAGVIVDGLLYLFGGTNGDKKFNDMWTFNLRSKTWTEIICTNSGLPDVRQNLFLPLLLIYEIFYHIATEWAFVYPIR